MKPGWVARQLAQVRANYHSLPAWQTRLWEHTMSDEPGDTYRERRYRIAELESLLREWAEVDEGAANRYPYVLHGMLCPAAYPSPNHHICRCGLNDLVERTERALGLTEPQP